MPMWIVLAALASIAATAVLTWVLWRINMNPERAAAPPSDEPTRPEG